MLAGRESSLIIRSISCLVIATAVIGYTSEWASGWAFPRIVLLHGDLLETEGAIALVDLAEISVLGLMFGTAAPSELPEALAERPYVDMAFFWGLEWHEFVDGGGAVEELTPREASTDLNIAGTGRFYPAVDGEAALFWLHGEPLPASDAALEVLRSHRVPVEVPGVN
jgi:hypothetical protein